MKRALGWFGLLLLVGAALLVFDMLTQPFRSQARVEAFYQQLAQRDFSAGGKRLISTLSCRQSVENFSTMGENPYECYIDTLCGKKIASAVFYSWFGGAYMRPDSFSEPFARQCSEMLDEAVLTSISSRLDQGG